MNNFVNVPGWIENCAHGHPGVVFKATFLDKHIFFHKVGVFVGNLFPAASTTHSHKIQVPSIEEEGNIHL